MESESRSRWLIWAEIALLLWGAILIFVGLRLMGDGPLFARGAPESVAEGIAVSPTAGATDERSATPVPSETEAVATLQPTWTPSPVPSRRPTATPNPTDTPTPSPSATPTTPPMPTARPLQSPTMANVVVFEPATPVTAVPTAMPPAEVPKNAINILLLGSDQRSPTGGWRTDVMIVVSINPDGPSAAMLSIPRDLYVWVPDWGMAKINTADTHGHNVGYEGGGPGLLKQVLLYNLGIPVHYYARVDFDGFIRIIDTLGGIDLPVPCAMTDWRLKSPELDINLEENWELFTVDERVHHMDGDMALWYVRSRIHSHDFDRSRRQQQMLRAMMTKAMNLNMIPQLPQLWSDFSTTVETDLKLGEMLQLAALAPRLDLNKIKSRFVAGDAVMSWTTPDTNAYVLLPQPERIQELVADVFEPPALNRAFQNPPVVEVWNGTERPDLDRLALDNLAWEGLVGVWGEADRHDTATTQVIFYGQSFKGASTWSITKLFGVPEAQFVHEPNPDATVTYRVILGENFRPCVFRVWGGPAVPTPTPTPEWTPPPD
jgi:polyisoprenyl-teichoic acid--peptidoglycan teichoic acid transferase